MNKRIVRGCDASRAANTRSGNASNKEPRNLTASTDRPNPPKALRQHASEQSLRERRRKEA